MSLVVCGICKMNTLIANGKCQHCGSPLKMPIWKRKMRKREAYAILMIVIGLALIPFSLRAAVVLLLIGIGMLVYGFMTPRVQL